MIVSTTTTRTPASSTAATSLSSAASTTKMSQKSEYRRATPDALTSAPTTGSILSAGPFSGAPLTIGVTAITHGCDRNASLTPGSARIGPIDTTGLLGQTITVSASSIASSTPGAGLAS